MANPRNPALESFLKSIPLFSLMEPSDMLDLLRLLRPVELESGQVLFHQGEPGSALWVLGSGVEVSISAVAPDGGHSVIAYAKAGETVGEMALIDDGARSGTAVVIQGGPAHQVDAVDFHVLRSSRSSPAFKILRRLCIDLCGRIRATSNRVVPPGDRTVSAPQLRVPQRATETDLAEFAPFAKLPKVVQLALTQKLWLLDFPGVQPLFAEGHAGDAAYLVLRGEVSVGRSGKTLATMGPGSMIGLISVIDQGPRSASCVTTGPARLLRLGAADFDTLFKSGNAFALELVDLVARQLVSHLRQTNQMLPRPGHIQARLTPPRPVPALTEEDLLPEIEVLPLELEMEVTAA